MPDPRGKRESSLVEHLTVQAVTTYVSTGLSLDKYFYSADLLLLQADQYRSIGNQEQLYVMLLRYASLIVERVGRHKDLNKRDNPKYNRHLQLLTSKIFPELEELKLILRTRESEPVACSANRPADAVPISVSNLPEIKWYASTLPTRPPPTSTLNAPPLPDYSSHPIRVSNNALDFLSSDPLSPPAPIAPPSLPPAAATDITTPAAAPTSTAYSSISNTAIVSQQAYNRHSLYSRPGSVSLTLPAGSQPPAQPSLRHPVPKYPTDLLSDMVVPPAPTVETVLPLAPDVPGVMEALSLHPPALPSPTVGISLGPQEVQVMDMQSHGADVNGTCAGPAAAAQGGVKPYTKKAALRDVQIAVSLLEDFMRLAQANTRRGIESCGILAGVLSANDSSFTITSLIVPKQKGSSDQVEMLSEEEIFDVQMSRELYPLGWIHTHPTQTCFLSSIDIHTQCAYQTMLDEAVAIVMAPTDSRKRCGIFRLSTPGGMDLVQKCTNRGFHMHPPTTTGQEIYEFSGHTFLNPRLQHDVVDLR